MQGRALSIVRRFFAPLLMVLAAWWVIRYIGIHWDALREFSWDARPLRLFLAVVSHLIAFWWGVWIWRLVLSQLHQTPVPYLTLNRIWFHSSLARYIPGKVFQFVVMAKMSPASGVSAPVLLTSALLQMGFIVLAAIALAAVTLGPSMSDSAMMTWLVGGGVVGVLLGTHPTLINALLSIVPKVLGREVLRWQGSWLRGLGLFGAGIVAWILSGIGVFVLVWALIPVEVELLPQLAGVNALAFLVGYVSFLPGGIGLREVAMTELLHGVFAPGVAVLIALAARLCTIVSELTGAALAELAARVRKTAGELP